MTFKNSFWLISVFFIAGSLYAGDIDLVESDRHGVTLDWKLDSYEVTESEKFSRVQFPGGSGLYAVGKPNIPSQQAFIEIPKDATIEIRISQMEAETVILEKPLAPAQEPVIDTIGAEELLSRNFIVNEAAYQSSEAFPSSVVEVAYQGILRGRKLALIRFNPVQYIAQSRELIVYKKLQAHIEFQGATVELAQSDALMDPIVKALVKNYQPARKTNKAKVNTLILTVADLQENAEKLALWKNQKGLAAKVEIVRNASESTIKDIIKAHYPDVAYVTILGDHPLIPLPKSADRHPLGSENCQILGVGDGTIPSDLYYSCLEGDDYYPDVHIGRIPANNKQEADVLMKKILDYQQKPQWSNRFLLCGEFQYQSREHNMAERLFCETAFTIHNSLSHLYDFPKETIGTGAYGINHSAYYFRKAKDETQTDRPGTYRSKIRDSEGPVKNCQMPASWTKNIVRNYDATTNTLDYWEKGPFLVQHRDHGSYTSWGKPSVMDIDVKKLKNEVLPILFSINCLTGGMDQSRDCFVEAALKNPQGGAAAALGSTRVSYSWWNDRLCDGFYTSLFGTEVYDCLDTGVKLPSTQAVSKKLGEVLNFGKMYLALNYPSNPWGTSYDYTETEFYLFHCIGDPEMQIWTKNPSKLDVKTTRSRNGFSVQVNAQENREVVEAQVCLYKEGDKEGQKEGEQLVLTTNAKGNCSFPSDLSGSFTLTVTGENLYPYQTTVNFE